jgi:hypothetical protein
MKGQNMDDIEELEIKLKKSKDNIHLYNKNTKTDKIENIAIDTSLPLAERIYEFFKKVNNPYILKVGNIVVEMEFSDNSNISPIECIDNALINDYKSKIMSKV